MDLYNAVRQSFSNDEGVSPVIAVILMVAITVVLAATVYVWVSGFASDDTGPEQSSATAKGLDQDDNGDVEWVRVTLVQGQNAPYEGADVTVSGSDAGGNALSVCETASWDATNDVCTNPYDLSDTSTETWDVGESLYIPCDNLPSGGGNVAVTASVKGTTILDSTVKCEQDPTP